MARTVLVTGAGGFIGTAVYNRFKKDGYNVIGWSRRFVDDSYVVIDLLDYEMVKREINQIDPEIVLHCAGTANVSLSIEQPQLDFESNVIATKNLLTAIHENKSLNPRVVFLSSAGIYGNPMSLPIPEVAEYNPLSPYALHKSMCEQMCVFYRNAYGYDIRIARIFSAYGQGLKKQIFWDMYQKYMQTGRLDMYGSGNESRDFIEIRDVVNALLLLSTVDTNDFIFNVANGEEITVKNVVKKFASIMKIPTSDISFNGVVRAGDPLNWRADISKIRSIGYKKTVDISEGLTTFVNWARENA